MKLVVLEDEHLLVVNKPAGINTHSPSPWSSEGLYDWLKHREPRWSSLAILHRLDKETSGLMVFGKTRTANQSLADEFSRREVSKNYLFLTNGKAPDCEMRVSSHLVRVGDRYASRPGATSGDFAETLFRRSHLRLPSGAGERENCVLMEAEPLTGRTHQIRVHASESGFPILGDTLYGGSQARRVFLHAAQLRFHHPVTREELEFSAVPDFSIDPRMALRDALIEETDTNAVRLIHGASDGRPGWFMDRLGDYLLSQSEAPADPSLADELEHWIRDLPVRGAYHKRLTKTVRGSGAKEVAPKLVAGKAALATFHIRENGVSFEMSFDEGYSLGLFLDQRDNRRRIRTRHIAAQFPLGPGADTTKAGTLLNAFAYTCGFSVCGALAGFQTTSLDLSKKYLEWGKRNFIANGLNPADHDFVYGDVFDWLARWKKKGRRFDVILLDPPTFSQSKESGVFRAEKDYGRLVHAAMPLLPDQGLLFASCNAARWDPPDFLAKIERAVEESGRKVQQRHYAPQPPDFPVSRGEPAYLKTVWLRIAGNP